MRELLAGDTVRGEPGSGSRELGSLAEALRAAEAELDAFMLDLANRERYGDRYSIYLDARLRAVEQGEAAYQAAASTLEPLALAPLRWEDLGPDDLHAVVAGAVDAIFVRRPPRHGAGVDERAFIAWRGAEDHLAGRGRKVAPIRPFPWPAAVKSST